MAKQNIFETRQRAEELLQQAIHMWKLSDKSDSLEGLEDDPVFQLLFNAIAYQSNEIESQIAKLKDELIKDFREAVFVNEGYKAVPATAVITTAPIGTATAHVDEHESFILHTSKSDYHFIPLLESNVYQANITSVNRLDGRRWLVTLDFKEPITSIEGMAFTIKDCFFKELKITLSHNAQDIPLIAPWDYDKLPLCNAFSLNTLLYNRQMATASGNSRSFMMPYFRNCAMNLFARQNMQYYQVDEMPAIEPTHHLDLLFEFDGIDFDFNFSANQFAINTIILVNAVVKSATLSKKNPIVRIAGSQTDINSEDQFMHLLRPNEDQILGRMPVQVRRVFADRFNQGKLIKLLNELLAKYSSDFYAFQEFGVNNTNLSIKRIREGLANLIQESGNHSEKEIEGVYLLITNKVMSLFEDLMDGNDVSMDVEYMLTSGSAINNELSKNSSITNEHFNTQVTRQVIDPIQGVSELNESSTELSISRYFTTTEDVIVTPADIKLFCVTELSRHYGITQDMIQTINMGHKFLDVGHYHTYVINVNVIIKKTVFTQRFFTGKIAGVELYLSKMIEVRSNGLYPIQVHLELK